MDEQKLQEDVASMLRLILDKVCGNRSSWEKRSNVYMCINCGHYSFAETPYCAYCGCQMSDDPRG